MTFLCVKKKELETRDEDIIERFGTLISRLKTEKGLRCSVFWVLFTIRRIQYLLAQFFMNFNYVAQISLNLGFTVLMIGYIIVLNPLKKKIDAFNVIFSEICIGICFSLVLILIFLSSEQSKKVLNDIFLFTIVAFLGVQTLISLVLIGLELKKIWFEYEKKRALDLISKAPGVSLKK